MKLTLRTLLAWRDRVLPEQDHRELDQKVAATELAQKLEKRIRGVLAQTNLHTARVEGRGLAASMNSVAEFLDNAMEPELLATFEANCVESDAQLCEVAECHQLLAGMAGQLELKNDLSEAERKQLGEAIQRRSQQLAEETEHATDVANARAIRAELDALDHSDAEPPAEAQPASSPRRRPSGGALAAAAAVALLLLLAVILGVQLFRGGDADREQQVAERQPAAAVVAAADAAPALAANEPEPAADATAPLAGEDVPEADAAPSMPAATEPPPAGQSEPRQPPQPEPAANSLAPGNQPATPAASGRPPASGSMADRPQVPQGTAMAIAATALPQPAITVAVPASPAASTMPTTIAPAPPAAEEDAAVLGFLENDAIVGSGFVLHRSPTLEPDDLDGWRTLAADSRLAAQEEVLVPPGLSPSFNIRGVQVRMRPGTHAILKLDSVGNPRVELLSGSLIIRSGDEAAQLGLAAGGLNGIILSGLPGGVAVELAKLPATELAARQTDQTLVARLLPLSQPIGWRQTQPGGLPPRVLLRGIDAETVLKPSELIQWIEDEPREVTCQPIDALPAWAVPLRRIAPLEKAASEALVMAVTSGDPLLQALIELSVDRRIENRMVAVETLALLGRYDELVELLREPPPTGPAAGRWEQLEAETIPLAFSDPTLALVLEKAFRDHLAADQATAAIGLARRNLPASSSADLTRQLIDLLENDDLMLRRYAFAWLSERFELEPSDLIQYRADWSAEQRRDGADWWRKRLEKGLLVPRPPAAATTVGSP